MSEEIQGVIDRTFKSIKNFLEKPSDVEYLIVSIYRLKYIKKNRKKLMKEIINHINNPDKLLTKVELVHRFSTLFNNRILGLEVQNASIYGSKIEMALDDFDRELANTIRKHDIIIIHRINKKNIKLIDGLASAIGFGTYSPSGVKEAQKYIPQSIKDKSLLKDATGLIADQFLSNEKPIFAGLITVPQSVMGNSIKLTIEAQDMVRIMQHINTEEHRPEKNIKIPRDMDEFVKSLTSDSDFTVKGDDHVAILRSTLLKTLAQAVYEEIISYDNIQDVKRSGVSFIKRSFSSISGGQLSKFNDRIIIRAISNGMYVINVSPIKAMKLFTKYYAKNTGISAFFEINTWDNDFYGDKDLIETIYENIYKEIIGRQPYFSFGIVLRIVSGDINRHGDDHLTANGIFQLFKDHPIQYTFTEKSFDNIFKHRVLEGIVMKYFNNKPKDLDGQEVLLADLFLHMVKITERGTELEDNEIEGGYKLFNIHNDGDARKVIISKYARQNYLNTINDLRNEFANTIPLDFIVNSNFASVRSSEFNPVLTNQMKSVPITQVLQLFIGAMTSIPLSQSKNLTGYDNTAYNISQRIWLSSSIGFRSRTTGDESWVYKKNYVPVIYFGLRYSPSVTPISDDLTYISDKDVINSNMYTLPSVGSMAIYEWGIEEIRFGFSRFNEGDLDSVDSIPHLSLGGTSVFDLEVITNSPNDYVSENNDRQIGGQSNRTLKPIPRIGLFKLGDVLDNPTSSEALQGYDDFNQITESVDNYWVYLGYDLYAMNGQSETISVRNNSYVNLYAPMANGSTVTLEDLGARIFNTTASDVRLIWQDSAPDFPEDNSVKIGTEGDKVIVTGIKDFYDPRLFLPILKAYKHFINLGFTGVNGQGDNNLYKDKKLFQIYHNIFIDDLYLDTYGYDVDDAQLNSISEIVDMLIEWIEASFVGDDDDVRLMMVKYARMVSTISPSVMNNDTGAFRSGSQFHPPSLLSSIQSYKVNNIRAEKTINILSSFTRALSHYMNRFAKESTTGGVLYCPIGVKGNGSILDIGDAISFKNQEGLIDGNIFVDVMKDILLGNNKPETNLDIYKKMYYVWKITYYFGGAGTDPSGSSGNTMRIYVTDSGIHWQSSFEEKDITTLMAETMQLNRLAVKF